MGIICRDASSFTATSSPSTTTSVIRCYSQTAATASSSSVVVRVSDRLGLGGHKWSRSAAAAASSALPDPATMQSTATATSSSADAYTNLVHAAYQQGIRTFEAGQEGGDAALARALETTILLSLDGSSSSSSSSEEEQSSSSSSSAPQNDSKNKIQCLVRVGYRTVVPPAAEDVSDAEVHNLFFDQDVPIPIEDTTSSETQTRTRTMSSPVYHNIGKQYLQFALAESPLVQLQAKYPDQIAVIVMLHNPEVQQHHLHKNNTNANVNDDDDDDDDIQLRQRLATAFQFLQQAVDEHKIAGYGIASNGMSLPPQHPLHLSWHEHILPAARMAHEEYQQQQQQQQQGAHDDLKTSNDFRLNVLQFPMNLLETTGIAVAQQIHNHFHPPRPHSNSNENEKDSEKTSSSFSHSKQQLEQHQHDTFLQHLQIYAMRPLTCYPDRGTGTGHPFILADYAVPATLEKTLQWTHQMAGPPAVYQIALKTAMAHFDATELVEAKLAGEELSGEQRETLDGCKLMQSLLHDVDAGLDKVRSFAAHEEYVLQQIIPLIHDTFEAYDEDTANVLQTFFGAYSLAVRYAIAVNTRELLTGHAHDKSSSSSSSAGSGADSDTATYPDLPPDQRLQEFALEYLLKEPAIDKIILGATEVDHIADAVQIVGSFDESKMKE